MARYSKLKKAAFVSKKPCPICKEQMFHQGYETKNEWRSRVGVKFGAYGAKKLRYLRKATGDHMLPKSRGGKLKKNILIMCLKCNCEKGDRTLEEWLGQRRYDELIRRLKNDTW